MTAITQQKHEIRAKIREEVRKLYLARKKEAREGLFVSMLRQYLGTMTLRQLEDWAKYLGIKDD